MDSLNYHKSIIIGSAARKGNGWTIGRMTAFGVSHNRLFFPRGVDSEVIQKVQQRVEKKRARP